MVQKNSLHFFESNGILFAKFQVTKLKIRILQIYMFFCYFYLFRKKQRIFQGIFLEYAREYSTDWSKGDLKKEISHRRVHETTIASGNGDRSGGGDGRRQRSGGGPAAAAVSFS
jgi:uncharacterized membrane protein YgcG